MQLLQHDKEDYFLSIPSIQKKNHHQNDIILKLEELLQMYENIIHESIVS